MAVRDKERRLLTPDRKGEVGQTQPLFYGPRWITSKESSPNNDKLDSHGSARKCRGEASVGPRYLCLEGGNSLSLCAKSISIITLPYSCARRMGSPYSSR